MSPDTQDDWELKQLAWSLQIDPAHLTIDELRAKVKAELNKNKPKRDAQGHFIKGETDEEDGRGGPAGPSEGN